MRGLKTFFLVALLAIALGHAEAPPTPTCPHLGPDVQCTPPSHTTTPAGGVALRNPKTAPPTRIGAFTALQLNLCNSGIAGCFTGRATTKATQVVLDHAPALVTVNEACETDVTERLLPAMLTLFPNEWLFWTFAPAAHRGTVQPVMCTPDPNGRPRGRFGNGSVGRLFTNSKPTFTFEGGLFPDENDLQDRAHAELRSFVCANVNRLYRACTTHLDNPSATGQGTPEAGRIASTQCRFLTTMLATRSPALLLGDLNLGSDPSSKYNATACAPPGWAHSNDGGVQHALATKEFGPAATTNAIEMAGATDHPALLVTYSWQPIHRNVVA